MYEHIMSKKVFNRSLHKEFWLWLAENPEKGKCDWPRWKGNGGDIAYVMFFCFACDVCDAVCNQCPLEWPANDDGNNYCDSDGGIFFEWYCCKDMEIRYNLAKAIAEMSLKTDIVVNAT